MSRDRGGWFPEPAAAGTPLSVRTMYLVYWAVIAFGLVLWIGVGLVVD